ncbi:MAG: hypothetical protein OHK0052_09660 [Anaerolineales bacterium]
MNQPPKNDLPFVLTLGTHTPANPSAPRPKAGDRCQHCEHGTLDYDGTLNLVCTHCGRAAGQGGCFT